jgi:hypothetical protein
MDQLRLLPSLRLLQYAFEGYRLSPEEVEALERCGWARSLPREHIASLRRSSVLSWEVMRLEERRRDRMPSSHQLAWLAERFPGVRRRRDDELKTLSTEIERCQEERARLFLSLPPLEIAERDRLSAYRPVSETCCIRLTDEGRKALGYLRFSSASASAEGPGRLQDRIERMTEAYRLLQDAPWWSQRLKDVSERVRSNVDRDGLWLSAVLSLGTEAPEARVRQAEDAYQALSHHHLWRQDPLPLCLILLTASVSRSMEAVAETNNALVGLGCGVGIGVFAGAVELVAGTPPSELRYRISEFFRLWKTLTGYGLAFTDAVFPAAARLASVRRPVEQSATLLRELDNKTTRFHRMDDFATRIAAFLMAGLPLDYRERGENLDLFSREETYVQHLIQRYRTLKTAFSTRCASEPRAERRSTIYPGLLALCPGPASDLIPLFDRTRRLLAETDLPKCKEESGLAVLVMDSCFGEEWGVNHSRSVWDLYFTGA